MPLTDRTTLTLVAVQEDGSIQVRTTRRILDGKALVGETHHRAVLAPGSDLGGQLPLVKKIAAVAWTSAVISAARKAAR